MAYCYQNLAMMFVHYPFLAASTCVSSLCFCAVTKDAGWKHPDHCCNAKKSGLRTKLGLMTRKEAKLIENVVQTTL